MTTSGEALHLAGPEPGLLTRVRQHRAYNEYFWAYVFLVNYVSFPPTLFDSIPTMGWAVTWILGIFLWGSLAYGWLIFAYAALRRAARVGRWRAALGRGLALMLAFAGCP